MSFICTLTVPSDDAVKNSDPVLLDIHMVLKTGSECEAERGISPTGLPPVLKKGDDTVIRN